jgi:hypothetical protein
MLPSMSRPANPYDNATCESFLKTLKREEIHASTYGDFEDLRERMEEFIEGYYNVCRLHSALEYRAPESFEKESQRKSQRGSAAAMMTFFEGYCGHLAVISFGGRCAAQLCLSEGFTLWDFCWKSTVHELCTNTSFSAYWG